MILDLIGLPVDIFELIKTLHPTPAVSGYPINKAYQLINKYEQYDRGWYSGPIGWVNAAGDGDFCVSLRSGYVIDNIMHIFSGAGIVEKSGSWFSYGDQRIGQGRENAKSFLQTNTDISVQLEREILEHAGILNGAAMTDPPSIVEDDEELDEV